MSEPRLRPIRNTLAVSTVAGVMLVVIAGCAGQPPNVNESDALAGVTGPGGGARTGVVVAAAGAGSASDGLVGTGPEYSVVNSLWNSESHRAAVNDPNKPLSHSLPQRYLAF